MQKNEDRLQLFLVHRMRSIEVHRTPDVQLQTVLGVLDSGAVLIAILEFDVQVWRERGGGVKRFGELMEIF